MDDFARFFENSLDLNGIANAKGHFRRVNLVWERTLGWTADEITASPWLEFVHPDDRQATIDVGQRLFAGASIISFENRYRCKDGSYRLIQWHAEAIDGDAYCSGRDITEERSRLDLRALVDNLPELAWTAKPDGFIDFYNRRWYDYTGTTYEDMQGWGWQSVHDPNELPRVMESWIRSIATHQPFDQAFPLRRKDGVFRWFLTRVAPMFDGAGELIRWVGINTDIDDHRRAQESLREMAAIVESADDAIITEDLDATIRTWNPGATHLLGYSAEEIVGQPVSRLLPEDRGEEESRLLQQVRAGRRVRHFETFRKRKDGARVAVSLTISPVLDRGGNIVAASKIMRDTSERKQAELERTRLVEELRALNADLEERVRSRTAELSQTLREREALLQEKISLLQEVHHRVKNNLQMISSLLNLQARQITDAETRAYFLESQGRVRSIALLHESLYQSADLGRVDMQAYVDTLVATLSRTYGETGARTRVVAEIDPVHLPVDVAVPCGLIVNELVTNALKHAFVDRSGAAPNEIRIEMRRVDGQLTLLVADNGQGFSGAVDPTRDETMGLTLVRDLSLQLRGHAEFASARGARCTIRFPAPSLPSSQSEVLS